ncbi:sigma-70 family RNA polymerase sigma factor [Fuerstiella marisgermanici]|uniref:RNA polymerase principal sigma factor HrdB n=1 Tax=Fuerstiella marisgermanici TaxID=1891926 RepID=A0A1P8WPT5_9PLAN|nr:sigma-70 family RNA polymerase sigma factor [Fuerstiella marisgermanici]APZ96072.1 RNA polymerase principal sigma factor HrdB [Fuerstiella marisgermanici]
MSRYRSKTIKELAEQQVRFAPQAVRNRQILQAEKFLLSVDGSSDYSFGDVCSSVTGYRPDSQAGICISGTNLAHDLRCFVEDLSGSLDLSVADLGEPVLTVQEVSEKFNVSAKTVDRWRSKGLASRRVKIDGRKRIVIPKSTLDRFVALNREDIDRGGNFRQMSESEREAIILEARSLVANGQGLTEVSRTLGKRHDRAMETIRYTLRDYDRMHPENALFKKPSGQISSEHQSLLYDLYTQGVSVPDLARRFGRTKPVVHSILADVRIRRLKATPIDFMDSDEFRLPNADRLICGVAPDYDKKAASVRVPNGLPAYLAELYTAPLLNKAQEQYYFRKMNFLKYQAAELQKTLHAPRVSTRTAKKIETLLDEANGIKNLLTRSNLRLVVSIAKRHLKPGVNFFELVSDGNMSLIRAIEKFDYARGNKFSTYASWAIMKNFARSVPAEHTQQGRFRTGCDEVFYDFQDGRGNAFADELVNKAQRNAILEILAELNGRERKVISYRFGLSKGIEPETLEEVGNRLGVTKERVRQIEVRTLEKLRRIAMRKQVDIPGI